MPVLINKETGLAENVADQELPNVLQSSTHDVPLVDPQGNAGTAPYADASDLIAQGYRQPNPEELTGMLKTAKFSSTGQQIKTGLEGAASAASFGASTAAERALGVKPEDIQAREEINPGVHALGEAAGLGASMFTGIGEGALLEKAGTAVAEKLAPVVAEHFIGRVGTAAARAATENMLFQAGDETSKMFAGDPNQSIETAAANVGLSGLMGGAIGGAFGSASELWKMGPGAKLNNVLGALSDRSGGLPQDLKQAAGIQISPEIEAALSANSKAKEAFQVLQESNSSSGRKAQELFQQFKSDIHNAIVETVGKTPEEAKEVSQFEIGKQAQSDLIKTLKETVEPISKKYEELESKFSSATIAPEARSEAANKISQMIVDENLLKGPNDAALNLANKVMEQLPKQATAQDIRMYIKGISDLAPFGKETYQVGKQLKNILRDLQDVTVDAHVAQHAPETTAEFASNQQAYKGVRDLLGELNDRLHAGKVRGPESWMQALKEMAPEDVLRRLSPKGDVGLQNLLSEQFPKVAETIKQAEWDKLLKTAGGKGEEVINPKKLFDSIEKLSPEMKQFIMKPEQEAQLSAIKDLMDRVPNKLNTSGTAKTLDALWSQVPASAAGMAAMAMGHSGPMAYIMTKLGTMAGKEVPDAVRLAMLKFLGSAEKVSAEGFKSAVHMADAVIKGEKLTNKAVDAVFSGSKAISEPPSIDIEKLKKQVDMVQENPNALMEQENKVGHYMPEHAQAAAQVTMRNLLYLTNFKPQVSPLGPLDMPRVASKTDESRYNNALKIAQQPLSIMNSVKEGSITQDELHHLQAMYPALYNGLQQKLMNKLIEKHSKDAIISYKTKLGISVFMAQPLDSSMMPASIMSTQPTPAMRQAQQPQQIKNVNKLDKLPNNSMTVQQQRSSARTSGH